MTIFLVILAVALIGGAAALVASGRISLPVALAPRGASADSIATVSDTSGLAAVQLTGETINFQVISGLTRSACPASGCRSPSGMACAAVRRRSTGAYCPSLHRWRAIRRCAAS
jgi:hypothetical protein